MARWIRFDGSEEQITPKNGRVFEPGELNQLVGGWLEALPLTRKQIMYVNEEGLLKELPLNKKAMRVLFAYRSFLMPLVGNVVVASLKETGDEE